MAKLALKGHPTRGSEVITFLEMLGGTNVYKLCGDESYAYYVIEYNEIKTGIHIFGNEPYTILTLEEFEKKFPYKIGDKVKSPKSIGIITDMYWSTIDNCVRYRLSNKNNVDSYFSADVLQPYKEQETMEESNHECINFAKHPPITDKLEIILGDYEIVEENGKYYAVKKKPKYPQTYEECCEVLDIHPSRNVDSTFITDLTDYEDNLSNLMSDLYKLLICRDAYWKIAGEQMELGKPWKPDWNDDYQEKWIINFYQDRINLTDAQNVHFVLAFPTKEMRDAFHKNFEDLIEKCKELL